MSAEILAYLLYHCIIMIEIGYHHKLKAYKQVSHGMFLVDEHGEEILLPAKHCPSNLNVGDEIEVFVCTDSQDRPIATTQKPLINTFGFAFLTCTGTTHFGAFMNWGMDRDLIIPNREQDVPINFGERHLTFLYIDEEDRLTGTTMIPQCLEYEDIDLKVGQEVELLIYARTDMGVKVIIDDQYGGVIYKDDIYTPIHIENKIKGYIRRIREDKLIDCSMRPFGYQKVKEKIDPIIEYLNSKGGFAPLHDKSDPELIKAQLNMSKKVFKKAIGGLYKKGLVTLSEEGISLVKKKP